MFLFLDIPDSVSSLVKKRYTTGKGKNSNFSVMGKWKLQLTFSLKVKIFFILNREIKNDLHGQEQIRFSYLQITAMFNSTIYNRQYYIHFYK